MSNRADKIKEINEVNKEAANKLKRDFREVFKTEKGTKVLKHLHKISEFDKHAPSTSEEPLQYWLGRRSMYLELRKHLSPRILFDVELREEEVKEE
jgi:hypothetical protein